MAYSSANFLELNVPKNENYLKLSNSTVTPKFIYRINPPVNAHTGFECIVHLGFNRTLTGPIGLLMWKYALDASVGINDYPNIVYPRYCPPLSYVDAASTFTDGSWNVPFSKFWFTQGGITNIAEAGYTIFHGTPFVTYDPGSYIGDWADEGGDEYLSIAELDKIIHLRYVENYIPATYADIDNTIDSPTISAGGFWIVTNIILPVYPAFFESK